MMKTTPPHILEPFAACLTLIQISLMMLEVQETCLRLLQQLYMKNVVSSPTTLQH